MVGAIVHEWISQTGGSEKVLDAMVRTFPDASIQCLWNDVPNVRYPGRSVSETWLARTPLRKSKAAALMFMPMTRRLCTPADADWVLASSHLFAHHIKTSKLSPATRKFSYVYTPARYIWEPELDLRGDGVIPRLIAPSLRGLDRRRAKESFEIAAISQYVRTRIARSWGRDARVIYPPVEINHLQSVANWTDRLSDVERELIANLPKQFLLGASRFVAYKRLDLVITAGEAAGIPVVLAGGGPDEIQLRRLGREASVPVYFVSEPTDALLYALYQAAQALVFLAVEDFGIMPVEAMALGTPAIVRNIGGASETVIDGLTGAHVCDNATDTQLREAVDKASSCVPAAVRVRAEQFSSAVFEEALSEWISGEPCVRKSYS